MRSLIITLLALLATAGAAELEEVILREGASGQVEVLATTVDSITVQARKGDASMKAPIKASALDPHCFYQIRRKHMEDTAENHIELAKYCIDNELFARAQRQIQHARDLDEAYVEKVAAMPGVREGIARKVLAHARRELQRGKLDDAEKWASLVMARAGDTEVASEAEKLLDAIDAAAAQLQEAAATAQQEEAAQELHKHLAPFTSALDRGRTMRQQGLRQRNPSTGKRELEKAGKELAATTDELRKAQAATEDSALAQALADLEQEASAEAVKAYLGAGEIDISRGAFTEARKQAQHARAVDPDSAAVEDFLSRVSTTEAIAGSGDANRIRPGRRR
jgi:hypothetical protein